MPVWCAVGYVVHHAVAAGNFDWLWAALIGVGGAVVGGLVAGWWAVRAAQKQWQRDREDSRTDRSRQAAMGIAEALSAMGLAIATWQARPTDPGEIAALTAAYNEFLRSVAAQGIALTDADVRSRVRAHLTFVRELARLAYQGGTSAPPLADRVQAHGAAVLDALDAHVHGSALPPYQPLPLNDAAALARWIPTP